jgi:hypothetical protein
MKTPIEKVDVIMSRLGFNLEASDGAKAAFIKNLVKQAYGVEVNLPPKYQSSSPSTFEDFTIAAIDKKLLDPKSKNLASENTEQLSFNLGTPPKAG